MCGPGRLGWGEGGESTGAWRSHLRHACLANEEPPPEVRIFDGGQQTGRRIWEFPDARPPLGQTGHSHAVPGERAFHPSYLLRSSVGRRALLNLLGLREVALRHGTIK